MHKFNVSSSMGEVLSSSSSSCNSLYSMCEIDNHPPIQCPWINSKCKNEPCNGVRRMLLSQTADHPGEKFFNCSICNYFEWFVAAIDVVKSLDVHLPANKCCFACGNINHVFNACSFQNQPCKKNCSGKYMLKVCRNKHNYQLCYLQCNNISDISYVNIIIHIIKAW